MTRTAADTYRGLRAFTDELVRCGVTHACTSPGSRSTPLVLSLVRDGRLATTSHIDERSGSFFALGVAKVTGRPSVLACTSGTAAANYAPAVIEAYEARVPLLVLTADRPPELRDVGAGQTIDQVKLYGRAAKWYLEIDDVPMTPARLQWMRSVACRAVWTALDGRPGPVHLNFALREPLVLEAELDVSDLGGREDGRPWVDRSAPAAVSAQERLIEEMEGRSRVVVVAGRDERGDGEAVAEFASRWGVPLLADPLSGARRVGAIAHYDLFLRSEEWPTAHVPDLVIRTGDLPTSKPLRQWLAALPADTRQIALDPEGAWQDPSGSVNLVLPLSLTDRGVVSPLGTQVDARWLEAWREADRAAAEAVAATLGDGLSEPAVAATLAATLPSDAALVVASSMPIRDMETYATARTDPPRVLSNRGANGIDGTLSTAFGVAHAHEGPTVLLTGDVAFLHDLGGLLAARRTGTKLVIVLVNNDGGGIFHFLPVAREGAAFEQHVATPHGVDFEHVAPLFGIGHERASDLPAFHTALGRALDAGASTVIEVRTARGANRELHAEVARAAARSVRGGA